MTIKAFLLLVVLLLTIAMRGTSQTQFTWPDSSEYNRVIVNANQYIAKYLTAHPSMFLGDRVVLDLSIDEANRIGSQAAQLQYTSVRALLESRGMAVGTYVSGTSVIPLATEPRWPYGNVPIEWMSPSSRYAGSWPKNPDRKLIDVTDPATRQALQAGIARLWKDNPAPIRFVDNAAAHRAQGATQPWHAYCLHLGEIRGMADAQAAKAVFNIAMLVGMLSDVEVQELIKAVGTHGILIEQPWAPYIRNDPGRTRQAMAQYRQLLDAGMAIILLPFDVPGEALSSWVRTWRKPKDHLYIGGSFFKAPDPKLYGVYEPKPLPPAERDHGSVNPNRLQ